MPTLIPEENFLKESEHVEGFTPEVFWVTEHGSEKFENRYALRPTSETAFYYMFKYWVQSYKDLPLKTYQRANVFRYDSKATKPFFRGREFYWYETHNIFSSLKEAEEQVLEDMYITEEMLHERFAIPFIFFKRPEWDKFPGAVHTYAADAIMPNGKILQLPSTHLIGDKFPKTFEVTVKGADDSLFYPFGTCYGPAISRIYGGMIGVHGDSLGLRIPFELAPIQVILVPLYFKDADNEGIERFCYTIAEDLNKMGYRAKVDLEREKTPKERFNHHEMKGVPVRIEVGPRDLKESSVMIFRRDLNFKRKVEMTEILEYVREVSSTFTKNLKDQADKEFEEKIFTVSTYEDLIDALEDNSLVRVPFCSIDLDGRECADKLKTDTKGGEVRGTRMDYLDLPSQEDVCVVCKKKATVMVYVGKSY